MKYVPYVIRVGNKKEWPDHDLGVQKTYFLTTGNN